MPKLTLSPCNAVHEDIFRAPDGQVDWPALTVAATTIFVNPCLPIPIEQRFSVASQCYIGPSKLPRSVQTGICYRKRVADPVLQVIGAPHPFSVDVNADIFEICKL